jgi:hypothetical protein
MGKGVVAEKPNVIGTAVFADMRSVDVIEKEIKVTCVKMPPLLTAALGSVSVDVSTVTAIAPAVTGPMVKPDIVTVNATAAGMLAPAVVITTDVAVVALHVPVRLATLLCPEVIVGVVVAKNAEGYVRVMVLPGLSKDEGVKPSVTGTFVLAAMRSDDAMPNEIALT